jgi:Spy/CpxP family protein refolding chaperone
MRNILRVGAALFALLVATDVASAQGGGRRGGGANGTVLSERYLAEITLTDDQKAKLAPIVVWYDSVSATLPQMGRGGGGGDTPPDTAAMRVAREARQKLNTDFQAKIKAVLTPEQVTKFDANVAAAGQRGRRGGGN